MTRGGARRVGCGGWGNAVAGEAWRAGRGGWGVAGGAWRAGSGGLGVLGCCWGAVGAPLRNTSPPRADARRRPASSPPSRAYCPSPVNADGTRVWENACGRSRRQAECTFGDLENRSVRPSTSGLVSSAYDSAVWVALMPFFTRALNFSCGRRWEDGWRTRKQ